MIIGNCPVCGAEMRVGTDMTNGDRIRAMTDEELAEFITNTDFCELLCLGDAVCKDGRCDKKLLDWLREEVAHD